MVKKETLIKMLDDLALQYPPNDDYSLDRWMEDGSPGFPTKFSVEMKGIPDRGDERDAYTMSKYGFYIDSDRGEDDDEQLYYNGDLRSYCGDVLDDWGDDGVNFIVDTTGRGLSPVGSQARYVRKIIEDADKIFLSKETEFLLC
jgi:hypothetical protein